MLGLTRQKYLNCPFKTNLQFKRKTRVQVKRGGESRRAVRRGNWGVKHESNETALQAYVTYSNSRPGAETEIRPSGVNINR